MLGQGTYGVVYRVRDKRTKKEYALKKVKVDRDLFRDGFPVGELICATFQLDSYQLFSHFKLVFEKFPFSSRANMKML